MKRGYSSYHSHSPFLRFVFVALAVLLFIKLLPFLLPLLLLVAGIVILKGWVIGGCDWSHFRDQFDEKQKRKNDRYMVDDDEPMII